MMRDAETYREADAEANARTEAKQEFELWGCEVVAELNARRIGVCLSNNGSRV